MAIEIVDLPIENCVFSIVFFVCCQRVTSWPLTIPNHSRMPLILHPAPAVPGFRWPWTSRSPWVISWTRCTNLVQWGGVPSWPPKLRKSATSWEQNYGTGWRFGTWLLWLSIYWEESSQSDFHIFQRSWNHQPVMVSWCNFVSFGGGV